ncbi:hypothetical protein [Peijinzhouia sedimentorum]
MKKTFIFFLVIGISLPTIGQVSINQEADNKAVSVSQIEELKRFESEGFYLNVITSFSGEIETGNKDFNYETGLPVKNIYLVLGEYDDVPEPKVFSILDITAPIIVEFSNNILRIKYSKMPENEPKEFFISIHHQGNNKFKLEVK